MRTQVFAYKGFVGIESSHEAEGLLNCPSQLGQLGFVLDANFVDVSPEACELLKKVQRSGHDLGDINVFKADNGSVIFSWLGRDTALIDVDKATGSSTYDASLLKPCSDVKIPQDFIDYVDSFMSVGS